jgi:transcriptional regulator with XRE-family HTH domain
MTSLVEARTSLTSTSAAGAMLMRQVREPMLVGVMLAGLGTSTVPVLPREQLVSRSPRPVLQTTAGASVVLVERAAAAIAELRRLSGFTWEQLARLFNVSRRSLHFWASGKAMTPANEEHLQRLLAVLRRIDRGSASTNRAALLAVRDDGTIPFDLLADRQYARLISLIGSEEPTARVVAPRLSDEVTAARAPRPPEELVGALQDRVHRETRTARAAKSVRVRSGR